MGNDAKKIVVQEDELVKNYTPEIRTLKKKILAELGKLWNKKAFEEIVSKGLEQVKELPQTARGEGDKEISTIHFIIGSAMKELGYEKETINYHALTAAHFDRQNRSAMWLLRDLRNDFSADSKYFLIEVKGTMYMIMDGEEKDELFFAVYAVVADDQEEAMILIKEFERPEVKDSLELFTAQIAEPTTDLPKGVYKTSALIANAKFDDEKGPETN